MKCNRKNEEDKDKRSGRFFILVFVLMLSWDIDISDFVYLPKNISLLADLFICLLVHGNIVTLLEDTTDANIATIYEFGLVLERFLKNMSFNNFLFAFSLLKQGVIQLMSLLSSILEGCKSMSLN
jgi:hypothetical protein